MPNSLGVFLTCDMEVTPAALSQLLPEWAAAASAALDALGAVGAEMGTPTALETDETRWAWGIKNESGRK